MSFSLQPMQSNGTLSVLQLTDLHLFAKEGTCLLGIDTMQSFCAVVNKIKELNRFFDFIIVTGDISQDYSAESYQLFSELISPLKGHIFFLPGNHDDGPLMYRMLGHYGINTNKHIVSGNWQFILLNSEVYGVAHGWLQREELDFMQECIYQYPDLYTVICVHHLPRLVGSRWLDTQTMHNQDEFNSIIHRLNHTKKIKLVLSGHVHQEYDCMHGDIRYISSPSTSIQFAPQSCYFALELKGPGFRYLTFHSDGNIQTDVYRLDDSLFLPDTNVGGY